MNSTRTKELYLLGAVLVSALALFLVISSPALTFGAAQSEEEAEAPVAGEEIFDDIEHVYPENTVTGNTSCFDHYSFGSVVARLAPLPAEAVSGSSITFSGTIKNENPYPIVDGVLYVKIFKKGSGNTSSTGPDVVDQSLVKADIVLPAGGSVPVSFVWQVPAFAVSGDYQLATFFTTSRKFNLSGLSFTDDVVGTLIPFKVRGEQSTFVTFDKATAKVDGAPYYFASFPPRVSGKDPIHVSATIKTNSASAEKGKIQWTVYQWDAQLRQNVVQEKTQEVTVPAKGSLPVSITVTDNSYPVYLVVGVLSWKDTHSVVGVRFMREGATRLRINFPGLDAFPLRQGEDYNLFSCVHNASDVPLVKDGRLELSLTDKDNNLIHEYQYAGDVTSDMMGLVSPFAVGRTYDYARLDARLYQGEKLVDEATLVYDCAKIDPTLCVTGNTSGEQEASFVDFLGVDKNALMVVTVGGLGILLILLWGVIRMLRKKPTPLVPPPQFPQQFR